MAKCGAHVSNQFRYFPSLGYGDIQYAIYPSRSYCSHHSRGFMMSPRIVYGDSQLLLPKIPTPAFRGCPGPEGVISSENIYQCTRSRIVILSCVPCGLHELKFGNLKGPETEVGPTVSDLYLMKRHVLPYDNLYLERRLPVFIVLSLTPPLVLCAELHVDPMLTRSKYR